MGAERATPPVAMDCKQTNALAFVRTMFVRQAFLRNYVSLPQNILLCASCW